MKDQKCQMRVERPVTIFISTVDDVNYDQICINDNKLLRFLFVWVIPYFLPD